MPLLGELSALAAALVWAISISLYVKFNAAQPSYVLTVFKGLITLFFLLILAIFLKMPTPIYLSDFLMLGVSGLVGIGVGDTASIAASRMVGAQLAGLSLCLAPPIAVVMAHQLCAESLNSREILGILIISIGCLGTILSKGSQHRNTTNPKLSQTLIWGILLVFICAISNAFGAVVAHQSMQNTNIIHGTLIRILPVVLVFGGFYAFRLQLKQESPSIKTVSQRQWFILAGIAFLGSFVGLLLFSVATKYAKAGVVSAIIATTAIWIIPISYLLLGERANTVTIVSSLVALSGVFLILIPS